MNAVIQPGPLRGRVAAPPSKSHVHRLLIAAALSKEETRIRCPGENEDIRATAQCLAALGARVEREAKEGENWIVHGPLKAKNAVLDCGESGTTLRFLLPVCAALDGEITLLGRGRLPQRPNGPLVSALCENGALIRGDSVPITTGGGLRAGAFTLPGDVSSQYFSGLLFALPTLGGDSLVRASSPLQSLPYVDLTRAVLSRFGIVTEALENGWRVPGGQVFVSPGTAEAEGDWSAAAFWLGANALGNQVDVSGLSLSSPQGDKAISAQLKQIGEAIDVSDTPDSMPVLSAVAAGTPGKTTRITGAARLRLKESDRIAAMARAIAALGGKTEEYPDGLKIYGTKLRGGTVDGMNDHRVVMSAAIAATICENPVNILGAEAVNKSYPCFWKDFEALGGRIHVG